MDFSRVRRITLTDGPVAYRALRNGQPPLLLIHGWGGSSRHWQTTAEYLGDLRSLYAPDLPGHGDTPSRGGAHKPEDLARLVIELADRLDLERFDLDGHSFGAALAILVAAQWPDRVNRLILTSPGAARNRFEQAAMIQIYRQLSLALALWRPWLAFARPWLMLARPAVDWLGAQPLVYRAIAGRVLRNLPDEASIRSGVRDFLRTDPISALECAISAGSPAFPAAVATLAAPTLVVHADEDPIMPAAGARALAARILDVRRVGIPDCGHLPMIERPAEYHRLVRGFLGERIPPSDDRPVAVGELAATARGTRPSSSDPA